MSTIYIDTIKHGLDKDDSKSTPVTLLLEKLVEKKADKSLAKDKIESIRAKTPTELFDFLLGVEKVVIAGVVKPDEVPENAKADRDLYDAFYSVLNHLLLEHDATPWPKEQIARVQQLATRLSTTEYSEVAELRLKQLMILYNSVPLDSTGRLLAFRAVLTHAKATGQLSVVRPYVARVDDWFGDWGITQDETHALYLQIADVYKILGSQEEQIKALYTLLDMYEGADKAVQKKHADVGVELLTIVTDAPHVLDFTEFLGLAVVQQLQEGAHAKLFAMVGLLARGDLKAFVKDHPPKDAFFATYKLSYEQCLTKMRLLTLANIAQAGELPLSDVATVLQMDEEEAEHWVVRAVSSGILNARVDQIKRVVLVKSAFQRSFGQDQWKKLHEQLGQWIGNLERISGVLATTRAASA